MSHVKTALNGWMLAVVFTLLSVSTGGVLLFGSPAIAQEQAGPDRLFYQAAYVRETSDRPWTVRLGKGVMSRPGCYIIIHNAAGRILVKQHVPYTGQTDGEATTIHVPADGITGDYRIVFVGFQNDSFGLDLPLTDLPLEVYGPRNFAARRPNKLMFRPAPGVKEMTFSSYSGGLRILRDGKRVADTAIGDVKNPKFGPVTFAVDPDGVYQVDPYGCFYFSSDTPVYLTFDIGRWFVPDPALDDVKWWLTAAGSRP